MTDRAKELADALLRFSTTSNEKSFRGACTHWIRQAREEGRKELAKDLGLLGGHIDFTTDQPTINLEDTPLKTLLERFGAKCYREGALSMRERAAKLCEDISLTGWVGRNYAAKVRAIEPEVK